MSSTSYTESQPESKTESQSSSGPHITQWLPQLVLVALLSLAVASIIGVSLSAVAFSNTENLRRPGQGIAQSLVMFASMQSAFYIPLHIAACLKAETLYLDPPLPSFHHRLHAWATLTTHLTVALWASACVPVAVGIYRGGGGSPTVHLKTDIFVCATGLLFSAILLTVIHLARRPFTLPWLSPTIYAHNHPPPSITTTATTTITLPFPKPPSSTSAPATETSPSPSPSSTASSSDGASSSSSSPSLGRSRARNMTRTRRYVLEAPTPVPLSPPRGLEGAGRSDGGSGAGSVPGSEGTGGKGMGRPGTPTPIPTPLVVAGGYGPPRSGKGGVMEGGRRTRMAREVAPSVFGFRKGGVVQQPVVGGGGGDGEHEGTGPAAPPPPPPSPPSPLPTYYVPGAWVPGRQSGEGVAMDV